MERYGIAICQESTLHAPDLSSDHSNPGVVLIPQRVQLPLNPIILYAYVLFVIWLDSISGHHWLVFSIFLLDIRVEDVGHKLCPIDSHGRLLAIAAISCKKICGTIRERANFVQMEHITIV